jgi:hypothetical protein
VRRRGRPRGARNNIRPATQVTATQTQIPSSQSIVPSTQIPEENGPLTPFERSTQREPSAHEHVLAEVTGRGRGRGRGRAQGGGGGRRRGRGRGSSQAVTPADA